METHDHRLGDEIALAIVMLLPVRGLLWPIYGWAWRLLLPYAGRRANCDGCWAEACAKLDRERGRA